MEIENIRGKRQSGHITTTDIYDWLVRELNKDIVIPTYRPIGTIKADLDFKWEGTTQSEAEVEGEFRAAVAGAVIAGLVVIICIAICCYCCDCCKSCCQQEGQGYRPRPPSSPQFNITQSTNLNNTQRNAEDGLGPSLLNADIRTTPRTAPTNSGTNLDPTVLVLPDPTAERPSWRELRWLEAIDSGAPPSYDQISLRSMNVGVSEADEPPEDDDVLPTYQQYIVNELPAYRHNSDNQT